MQPIVLAVIKHFQQMVGLNNFTKLNCTFRKKPDDLADKILDYADEIPFLKEKRMDVKFIYGRQISFAPHEVKVPDLPVVSDELASPKETAPSGSLNTDKVLPSTTQLTDKTSGTEDKQSAIKATAKKSGAVKKTSIKSTKTNSQIKK